LLWHTITNIFWNKNHIHELWAIADLNSKTTFITWDLHNLNPLTTAPLRYVSISTFIILFCNKNATYNNRRTFAISYVIMVWPIKVTLLCSTYTFITWLLFWEHREGITVTVCTPVLKEKNPLVTFVHVLVIFHHLLL
jgi:hypothetical protein